MDNLTEIKKKLDSLYEEYKQNNSQLNKEKTREAAKLLFELTSNKNVAVSDVAFQLSRFSADVVKVYFETITKNKNLPVDLLDEIIKEFLQTNKDANKSQYYVKKFVFAVSSIMRNYKEKAFTSAQLPQLVVFIAQYAVKSDKNRNKFQFLINDTAGKIFMLDYTGIKKESLLNVWNAANSIFPDMSKTKYKPLITEWAKKYGFIKDDSVDPPAASKQAVKAEEATVSNEVPKETARQTETQSKTDSNSDPVKNEDTKPADKKAVSETDEKEKADASSNDAPDNGAAGEVIAKKLYISLKRDMDKEQEAIINALTNMITPIGKAFETVQEEIKKSRGSGTEMLSLKSKTAELERQLSEQRSRLQKLNESLAAAKAENDDLKAQIAALESRNSELDSKLNDAYAINSRKASLEAEKIRFELKKSFSFLYEDWLEYEFSDVSEDNYESLQAIIKKVFRSLERNGIDFKENN